MNKLNFTKGQGGVPKTLPGEDHISGLLMYLPDANLPVPDGIAGFSTGSRILGVSSLEMAEKLGITADASNWYVRALHYHISEALRINPGMTLYVGLFNTPSGSTYDFNEVKTMQNFADGRLRQIAVYAPVKNVTAQDVTALQSVATWLEAKYTPLSILYAGNIVDVAALSTSTISGVGQYNVSVVIAQDGDPESVGAQLYADSEKKGSVTALGLALGALSKASVHESIAWIQKFPSGISTPAFADGSLIKETDKSLIESLDEKRYLFLLTYPGLAGSFWNDSHTMDTATSDYAYIESVRTIDKAIRGIRTYLLPYLASPIYVNAESGQLRPDTVTFLEQLAGRQLEDMERAGELSGYKVEIDPDQDVLATSTIEFMIKKVGVGVMRIINVKIGYTTKLD
ncbi:MAG: DUF2586 domain-containing protein [Bacteroidales bacterium]|nr:DUF2586 domain-containing protein [Bacteroidales bacterium]